MNLAKSNEFLVFCTVVQMFLKLLLVISNTPYSDGVDVRPQSLENLRSARKEVVSRAKLQAKDTSRTCTSPVANANVKPQRLSRHPRDVDVTHRIDVGDVDKHGKAIYFSGNGQLLKLKLGKGDKLEIPRSAFTVEFWIKPEGGQDDSVAIVDLFDECNKKSPTNRWSVGLRSTDDDKRRPKFYFALKTHTSSQTSELFSHLPYEENIWTHVAATYDGSKMTLYINRARVAVGFGQRDDIFTASTLKCKEIFLGGDWIIGTFLRGDIDEFRLWNIALEHDQIVSGMYNFSDELIRTSSLVLSDSFEDLKQWRSKRGLIPDLFPVKTPFETLHDIRFESPPCGKTVCDDPVAVKSYLKNEELRRFKVFRYRVVNIMEDDGSNPIVTKEQIRTQHKTLNNAFKPYNISFLVVHHEIRNTTLRRKLIIFGCDVTKIGDNECDKECAHASTGFDGGDCDPYQLDCGHSKVGNGECDFECNKLKYRYDGGDCCLSSPSVHRTCIDPNSPQRPYITTDEMKALLNLDASTQVNVYFLDWSVDKFIGLSTFPWEKTFNSPLGGTVVHPTNFGNPGRSEGLVHEMGHTLGLWHVHAGVSEMECDNPCIETQPSMVRGDLCSDTSPTPMNEVCRDPDVESEGICGMHVFENTPFDNFMSYTDDSCMDHFTPQQVARMHCYLDLIYQTHREMKDPAPIPLAPKVVSSTSDSVKFVWLQPLGSGVIEEDPVCTRCQTGDRFRQYASNAISSHSFDPGEFFSPDQAAGPPDGEHCEMSIYGWMPNTDQCTGKQCWLELTFDQAVVPERILIHVAFIPWGEYLDVKLVSQENETIDLGQIPAFCDMVATAQLRTDKTVDKVIIYISTPYVSIDAVELVSLPDFATCLGCKKPKYRITRDPPFANGYIVTPETFYIDRDIVENQMYKYRIAVISESRASELSPELQYTHGQSFCGDGTVDSQQAEECDDGNLMDGDGCSVDCRFEEEFVCTGNPSLCYRYENDGVCEDFEIGSNEFDCGFSTPDGYFDQWAVSATANPDYQTPDCPETAILGQPDQRQRCGVYGMSEHSWRPCGANFLDKGQFWIEVLIAKPVVAVAVLIHLASDGYDINFDEQQKSIYVELIDENDVLHGMGADEINISCAENPVVISVVKDLTQPFYYTKGVKIFFNYFNISLSAVRIRSSNALDPVAIASCAADELYSPRSGVCVSYSCSSSTCGSYVIKHGVAKCSGFEDGNACTVSCSDGYQLSSPLNTAVCVQGTWASSVEIACSPVDCHRPSIRHASIACPDGTTYGETCQFKCDPPARLQGANTTITCQADGHWSDPRASCRVLCEPLTDVPKADVITETCSNGPQQAGKRCKVRCNEGYHVEERAMLRRNLKFECGEDGFWQGPICVRDSCPDISFVFKGLYTCTDNFYTGSTCTLACSGDESIQTVTCLADATWSSEFNICPSVLSETCSMQDQVDELTITCGEQQVGSACEVHCTDRTQMPVFDLVQSIGSSDRFFLNADRMYCTVQKVWFPYPRQIKCVQRCDQKSTIGDGLCDPRNNRKYCDWDGGDCCRSTAPEGVVIPVSDPCVEGCTCKDPMAIENMSRRRRHNHRKYKNMFLI